MQPANLLFIMSDEHSRRVLGCYGHKMIRTPNLDALAARGVRFTDAYCNSPICVPSRASFATGRFVHDIRFWDNGIPYDGSVPSWGHRLRDAGHAAVSIGKLHFRSQDDDNGFSEEVMPLHVIDGIGDLTGMISRRHEAAQGVADAGRGSRAGRQRLPAIRRLDHRDRHRLAARQGGAADQALDVVRITGLPAFSAGVAAGSTFRCTRRTRSPGRCCMRRTSGRCIRSSSK